jgi:hypothetical protein
MRPALPTHRYSRRGGPIALVLVAGLIAASHARAEAKFEGASGVARVCLVDEELPPGGVATIRLPASTVFRPIRRLKGQKFDPASWSEGEPADGPSLIMIEEADLTKKARCKDIHVQKIKDRSSSRSDGQVLGDDDLLYAIDDVMDLPETGKRQAVEFGRLVDGMSVEAVVLQNVAATFEGRPPIPDQATIARRCAVGAQLLAQMTGAAAGRQTNSVVFLNYPGIDEASFGCPFGPKQTTDVFVGWDGTGVPPRGVVDFFVRAGEALTGAPAPEIRGALNGCVLDALKPASGELSDREFGGVKIECQAFLRDGGGGTATVYQRFGDGPLDVKLRGL